MTALNHCRTLSISVSMKNMINEIYNEDCATGMSKLPDNSIDMCIASPPYDNLRTYGGYAEFDFSAVAGQLWRTLKPGGVVVWIVGDSTVDGSETGTSFRQALHFIDVGFKLHDTMIWHNVCPYQHSVRYIQAFEYMFILSKGKPKITNLICDRRNHYAGDIITGTNRQVDGRLIDISGKTKRKKIKDFGARLNIWNVQGDQYRDSIHPAKFPVSLIVDHLRTWSIEKDIILDPFMGSGTTAIACIKTNRQYVGFEINPTYYAECLERIEKEKQQLSIYDMGWSE